MVSQVVMGTYRELFAAIAGASAALTGLLFVAISVSPGRLAARSRVISDVHAATALLAFTNALTIALFGLVPQTNVGSPATVVGVIGLLFTAAAVRSILISDAPGKLKLRQFGLAGLLVAMFGTDLGTGIALQFHPSSNSLIQPLSYAMIGALLVGIARAWELVGSRDTGLAASLSILTGHATGFDMERSYENQPTHDHRPDSEPADSHPPDSHPPTDDSSAGGVSGEPGPGS
jgi:hypothetical protein